MSSSRSIPSRVAIAAAAVLLSGLLGACGSSGPQNPTTTATAQQDPGSEPEDGENCDIVSDEAVASVLDAEVVRRESFAEPASQIVGCTKGPALTDAPDYVNVYLVEDGGVPLFDEASAEAGSQQVEGLGDRAVYLASAGNLIVVDGGDTLSIQVIEAGVPGSLEDCVTIADDMLSRRG